LAIRVALVMSMSSAHDRGVLSGIAEYARTHARWVFTLAEPWRTQPQQALRWRGEGIIGHIGTHVLDELVGRLPMPVVNVSETLPAVTAPSVLTDNLAVGREAARHLLERGFRHFACWPTPDQFAAVERTWGFEWTVRAAGFTCHHAPPDLAKFDINTAPAALGHWLRLLPKPVGLFTSSDVNARHAVNAAVDVGVAVPEQLAVVGVDDDELLSALAAVPLSSVNVPLHRKGYLAARCLDHLLAGRAVDAVTRIVPSGVVGRKSSDIMAVEDPIVAQAARFIGRHFSEPITVESVVEHVMASRRALERRFEQALGRSPAAELRRVRIERASYLLAQTRMSIDQIARLCGFTSATQLGRVFHRTMGLTPSNHRRRSHPPGGGAAAAGAAHLAG
jgi:LacI family transcriptional regulator